VALGICNGVSPLTDAAAMAALRAFRAELVADVGEVFWRQHFGKFSNLS
jgi:hypothetical protein